MSQTLVVEVEPRDTVGKNSNRRLRRQAKIPGVVYGLGLSPFLVAVNPRRLGEILHLDTGRNTIFSLALSGKDDTRSAMIKDLQRDPVTDELVHVDFIRLDLSKKITVKVPIRLLEIPIGVKNEEGVLDFMHREVEVECLPKDIPEHLDIVVAELHINQHVSVSDIPVGEGVRILDAPGTVIAVVAAPKAEEVPAEEEVAAAAAETAEPEVIKKGKEAAAEDGKAAE
jgi:large subunit ribosomal protein L25